MTEDEQIEDIVNQITTLHNLDKYTVDDLKMVLDEIREELITRYKLEIIEKLNEDHNGN